MAWGKSQGGRDPSIPNDDKDDDGIELEKRGEGADDRSSDDIDDELYDNDGDKVDLEFYVHHAPAKRSSNAMVNRDQWVAWSLWGHKKPEWPRVSKDGKKKKKQNCLSYVFSGIFPHSLPSDDNSWSKAAPYPN